MKVLFVHPSSLMHSEIFLRLEPLGLELVAESARQAGHEVRLLDLQVFRHADLHRELDDFRPDAVGFSLNYLANIPEALDLAQVIRQKFPECFVFAGGHSASFTAKEILEHSQGNIECIVRGEGEAITPQVLAMAESDRSQLHTLPGVITLEGEGPAPKLMQGLDEHLPARDLTRNRRKYFIGMLDPCASIEFSRGCPWDCVFCSAWTFYGKSYRKVSAERAGEDMARIRESGVFIVDDVAFIHPEHGHAIADEMDKRRIRKQFYLETRGDVLLRNKDVFKRWSKMGLKYMFLGLEAVDEEGLKKFRKRVSIDKNFEALEYARSLGIMVAVNIIADPAWDVARFETIREWARSVPEIVHLTVNTPYPGTETWVTESRNFTTRDYRLFDVQHAVLPTTLPLAQFYEELVKTQQVLNYKHLGWKAVKDYFLILASRLARGQTNFAKMMWKFHSVYNAKRQFAEHSHPTKYEIRLPECRGNGIVTDKNALYVHQPAVAVGVS